MSSHVGHPGLLLQLVKVKSS